tara:strand:- start:1514 stop:2437 length:924 start_codon:yes stop_codon:yes gene_type:complete
MNQINKPIFFNEIMKYDDNTNEFKEKKSVRFSDQNKTMDENVKILKLQELDDQIKLLETKIKNKKNKNNIPEIIFLIPYRDRKEQKIFFENYSKIVLEDVENYELYFVHQCDNRPFNRGAMKNIGFLAMKEKYKYHYKSITFVFHDIDTIPHKKNLFDYKTRKGFIKHFYGFLYALGGIVSINGEDFEKMNGYINNWGWGYEDNNLQYRAIEHDIKIIRNPFYRLGDNNILHLFDNLKKQISKKEQDKKFIKNNLDGLNTIKNLEWSINNEYINVHSFDTLYKIPKLNETDMRELNKPSIVGKKMFM